MLHSLCLKTKVVGPRRRNFDGRLSSMMALHPAPAGGRIIAERMRLVDYFVYTGPVEQIVPRSNVGSKRSSGKGDSLSLANASAYPSAGWPYGSSLIDAGRIDAINSARRMR